MKGDENGYFEVIKPAGQESWALHKALNDEDENAALMHFKDGEIPEIEDVILAYCIAVRRGNKEVSGQFLEMIISMLAKADRDRQLAADMFSGNEGLVILRLKGLRLPPASKRVIALGLGFRFPECRQHCFEIARRFNYSPEFPSRLIERLIASK